MLKLPKEMKIVEKFKYLIFIPVAIILAGVLFMIFAGMNVGVDFAGGAKVEVELNGLAADKVADTKTQIVTLVDKYISEHDVGFSRPTDVQTSTVSGTVTYEITLQLKDNPGAVDDTEGNVLETILGNEDSLCSYLEDELTTYLGTDDGLKVTANTIGATASANLIRSAALALSVAIVVMLIYIVIRFTFASALASVCALIHDVLIMIALTTIFRIPVNSTFIAAVITIVGYSINATIIIFDRIREERKKTTNESLSDAEIANMSITKTLGRTILTTLTTLVMVVMLAIFSVTTIQEFIIPIIFGLIAGTFSSVFLASSFWVLFRKIGRKSKVKSERAKA